MRTPLLDTVGVQHEHSTDVALSGPSLQDAFAKYVASRRKQKPATGSAGRDVPVREHDRKGGKEAARLAAAREERRAKLRELFVERARGYLGVPYARKHHDPVHCTCEGCSSSGRQLHRAPLFLDCCGLVRRVARSLEAQLGFRLGPGNQAYQYDTLPVRLERASQLQPGDLIFYSGVYCDPGSRRHPFDMTHVEIFVGGPTGEATIGSRERFKWVMEYDSFRFTSQRWRLLSYHFCSLDPWLDGLCVPQHPELWQPRRQSRTNQQQQQQQQPQQQQQQRPHGQKQLPQRQGSSTAEAGWEGPPVVGGAWDASRYSIFGGTSFPWPGWQRYGA